MGAISLKELALVAVIASCACGAHVLAFYLVARTLKSIWERIRGAMS